MTDSAAYQPIKLAQQMMIAKLVVVQDKYVRAKVKKPLQQLANGVNVMLMKIMELVVVVLTTNANGINYFSIGNFPCTFS